MIEIKFIGKYKMIDDEFLPIYRKIRNRYVQHRAQAIARGISYDLTIDDWFDIIGDHWDNIGKGTHQMSIVRIDPKLGWTYSNTMMSTKLEHMRKICKWREPTIQEKKDEREKRKLEERNKKLADGTLRRWTRRGDLEL